MLKRALIAIGLCLLILIAILLVRTYMLDYEMPEVEPVSHYDVDEERAIERFSQGLTFQTVSSRNPEEFRYEEMEAMIDYIEQAYPELHKHLERERVNEHSLLYRWEGSNPDLKPIMMLAHMDVVPVAEGTEDHWTHPPYSGTVADGFVWGRGAIDDKSGVYSYLEAVEYLVENEFEPERTIYVGLGHDEEVGGEMGAAEIAETFKQRDIELAYILNEGMPIAERIVEDIEFPIAMIGVAEKGYLDLELVLEREGGHSSMPPRQTSIGELSAAIERLKSNQMEGRFGGLIKESFEPMAPHLPFMHRMALANLWLFRSVIDTQLSEVPHTNAALRTSTAPTIFNAGVKENVLPTRARAVMNFRIHPQDDMDEVQQHVRETIENPDIEINELRGARNPSPVSDTDSEWYGRLEHTIHEMFPQVPVTPTIFLAGTDSRHYHDVTDNIYRFRPTRAVPEDRSRLHGTDERMGVENFIEKINFHIQLLKNTAS